MLSLLRYLNRTSPLFRNLLVLVIGLRFRKRLNPVENTINVLMNGPSLAGSIEEISRSKHPSLAVNHFVNSPMFSKFRPKYYLVQDGYFWQQDVLPEYLEKQNDFYFAINKLVAWQLTLYLPSFANVEFIKSKITNELISIEVYNAGFFVLLRSNFDSYLNNAPWLFWLWRTNYLAPPPENVLVGALYSLYLSGCKHIKIYGADMSFFIKLQVDQRDNTVGVIQSHFYGEKFVPAFFDKQNIYRNSLSQELSKWAKVFYTFEILAAFFKKENIKITNRSSFSFIDSFERD